MTYPTTNALECLRRGFRFGTVPTRGKGRRLCLLCPRCGRKAFKLYRPTNLPLSSQRKLIDSHRYILETYRHILEEKSRS
jgi:hypothetical protein